MTVSAKASCTIIFTAYAGHGMDGTRNLPGAEKKWR